MMGVKLNQGRKVRWRLFSVGMLWTGLGFGMVGLIYGAYGLILWGLIRLIVSLL